MINTQIIYDLAINQRLNRRQFDKLFSVAEQSSKIGLFTTNGRLLTDEQIKKSIEDEQYLWTLYEYNANKLTDEHIIMAIDDELQRQGDDLQYFTDYRTKPISNAVVDYVCGLVDTLYGDDTITYGNVIRQILRKLLSCCTYEQKLDILSADNKIEELIEQYE